MPEQDLQHDIDQAWDLLLPLLVRYDGTEARDAMKELSDDDVWNAIYWRTHKWLCSWFAARDPRCTTLDQPGHSFAEDCLVNFTLALWPDRRTLAWKPDDLPQLLSKLREHGNELHRLRYPSREITQ